MHCISGRDKCEVYNTIGEEEQGNSEGVESVILHRAVSKGILDNGYLSREVRRKHCRHLREKTAKTKYLKLTGA